MANKKRRSSPLLFVVIVTVLLLLFLFFGLRSLGNKDQYTYELSITPTPSMTPRLVTVTRDPNAPPPTPQPTMLLFDLGATGESIFTIQTRLQALGYYTSTIDGQYGDGTKQAVLNFQNQHGLHADGIVGEMTFTLLMSESATHFIPKNTKTPAPQNEMQDVLSSGNKQPLAPLSNNDAPVFQTVTGNGSMGDGVTTIQQQLFLLGYYTGTIDGHFGSGTEKAVKAFQTQNNLQADGYVGQQTFKKLFSKTASAFVPTPTPKTVKVLEGNMPYLVNHSHPVDTSFTPDSLVFLQEVCKKDLVNIKGSQIQGHIEAVNALIKMLEHAHKDGLTSWQVSAGYRSVSYQKELFDNKVRHYMDRGHSKNNAISATNKTVATPGASEHHTGLAFDMTVPGVNGFINTPQCKWMHEHCWDYGFIVRYQEGKEDITKYLPEAWHIRYVGLPHSTIMRDKGICLEEYLAQ